MTLGSLEGGKATREARLGRDAQMAQLRRDLDRWYDNLGPEGTRMKAEVDAIYGVDVRTLMEQVEHNDRCLVEAKKDLALLGTINLKLRYLHFQDYLHLGNIRGDLGMTSPSLGISFKEEHGLVAAALAQKIAALEQKEIELATRLVEKRASMSGCPWISPAEKTALYPFAKRARDVLARRAA